MKTILAFHIKLELLYILNRLAQKVKPELVASGQIAQRLLI